MKKLFKAYGLLPKVSFKMAHGHSYKNWASLKIQLQLPLA